MTVIVIVLIAVLLVEVVVVLVAHNFVSLVKRIKRYNNLNICYLKTRLSCIHKLQYSHASKITREYSANLSPNWTLSSLLVILLLANLMLV